MAPVYRYGGDDGPVALTQYRGRFAPTPSGPLHFGSLVAAAGSYLDARSRGGEWLVRIEDLDPPRVAPGAADGILRTLEAYGFEWDRAVMRQSERTEAYRAAFRQLTLTGNVFACSCSRAGCRGCWQTGDATRDAMLPVRSWRVHAPTQPVLWADRRCGPQRDQVDRFSLLRADGVFSYQLAVVVDDEEQQITDVVRGEDLLDSTGRQIWLQRLLRYRTPSYLHLPVAKNEAGEKLSKQTHAPAIPSQGNAEILAKAIRFLGIPISEEDFTIAQVWQAALASYAAQSCWGNSGRLDGIPR